MAHAHWTVANFPRLVWHRPDANWDIYANANGSCAAIPTKEGAQASWFGNLAHVARIKREDAVRRGYGRKVRARSA